MSGKLHDVTYLTTSIIENRPDFLYSKNTYHIDLMNEYAVGDLLIFISHESKDIENKLWICVILHADLQRGSWCYLVEWVQNTELSRYIKNDPNTINVIRSLRERLSKKNEDDALED